jgi:hypothetical protein
MLVKIVTDVKTHDIEMDNPKITLEKENVLYVRDEEDRVIFGARNWLYFYCLDEEKQGE